MNDTAKYRGAPVPDRILRKMSPEDRQSLGKTGRTIEEITAKNAVKCERYLHNQILQYVHLHGWIALHGGMHKKTTRTLGEPDFVCILPFGKVVFVECKTEDGKLSEEQSEMLLHLAQLGHRLHVIRNLEQFISVCGQ